MNAPTPSAVPAAPAGIAGLDLHVLRQRLSEENSPNLKAPGSYEWWYFHTLSPSGDGITCALFHGLPFHPHYLAQLNRERLLPHSPFDKIRPDVSAARYPAAYCAVYQGGKKVAQFLNIYPYEDKVSEAADVRIGPNRITVRHDATLGINFKGYPFDIVRGQPRRRRDQTLSVQLSFAPTLDSPPHTRSFRSPNANGATHHWVLAAPHGQITGSAQLLDAKREVALLDLPINGIGYHDRTYGHGNLAEGIHKQIWGFLQGEDWTAAWHQTIAVSGPNDHAGGLLFFQKGHNPVIVDAPEAKHDRLQIGRWLMRHPGRIAMHGSDTAGHPVECIFTHSTMLDTAPFHTRLASAGSISIPGRGSFQGNGVTHLLQLRRLQWPILSDVTLQAIMMVPRDDPLWRA